LWARQKIADLEESRFDRQTAAEIDGKILQTALDHHIVSRLTSLVAVDITPSRPIGDQLVKSHIPTQLPDGWDFGKLAGIPSPVKSTAQATPPPIVPQSQPSLKLPSTASPHTFLTLLGLFLMGFGMMWTRRRAFIRTK
jgi:Ca-activated chloride channel family protein